MGVLKGFAAAHRYKGGFEQWVYDEIKALREGESGNTEEDAKLAARVKHLEDVFTSDISFTVKDDAGEPAAVSGATVKINGKTGTTGGAGGCNITGILWGTYEVEVTKTGFDKYTDDITVDGSHTSFNISLTTASS